MHTPARCLRCQGPMEPGFVVDHGHGQYQQLQQWVEGPPEKSFWTGLKTGGKERHTVTTYRCERCGWLESYAPTS